MNYTSLEHFASLAYPAAKREHFTDVEHYSGVESFKVDGVADKSAMSGAEFIEYLRSVPRAFVWFYAPWCGHCVRSKDEVAAAARASSTPFIAYNADQPAAGPISRKYKVQGFPTFVMIERGEAVDWFQDARTKDAFVRFAQ